MIRRCQLIRQYTRIVSCYDTVLFRCLHTLSYNLYDNSEHFELCHELRSTAISRSRLVLGATATATDNPGSESLTYSRTRRQQ